MGTTLPNGIYKPDRGETGWDDEVDANFDLLDDGLGDIATIQDTLDDLSAATGLTGQTIVMFRQEGEVTLATGTEPFPLPFDCDILGVKVSAMTPPSATPVEVDLLVDNTSVWQNSADRPNLPVGEYVGTESVPDTTTGYLTSQLLTVDITNVGLPSTGGGITIDVRDVSTGVTSNTTTKSNFNIPIPSNYHTGDLLVCFVATLAQTIASIPSGWSSIDGDDPVEDTDHPGAEHLYTLWKEAAGTESGSQQVVFSGATPMQAVTVAIVNTLDINNQPDDTVHNFLGTPSGDTFTTSIITSTQDSELVLVATVARFVGGATPSNIGADADWTVDYQGIGDRTGSAQTSIAMTVAHQYLATAQTIGTYDWTVTPGLFVRFVGRQVALFQGPSADTPGENVTATIRIREITA